MNRGHKMCLKRNRAESLGCHDRHPLPRVCLREPGSRDVINWQWRYVIRAQMICYRNNRYLHDVPVCLLVKNCPTPSGLPIPVTNEIQNAIQYKDRSPDWWCLAHTMTSARARGPSNWLFTAAIWPYATPEWRWIPRTKGQWRGKCFHLMTSSWITWMAWLNFGKGSCEFFSCDHAALWII